MPPPIVPAPMTADPLDRRGLVSSRQSGNLGGLALGKEQVALGFRLIAGDELHESSRSRARPWSNGKIEGARTASTQACGALRPRARFGNSAAVESKRAAVGLVGRELVVAPS